MASKTKKSKTIDILCSANHIKYFGADFPLQSKLNCAYRFCGCRRTRFIWISHKKKAIYFDIPKAASSSIRQVIGVSGAHAYLESTARAIIRHGGENNVVYKKLKESPEKIKTKIKSIFKKTLKEKIYKEVTRQKDLIKQKVYQVDSSDYQGSYGFKLLDLTPIEAITAYKDYYSFTFVRSPWNRVESAYKMIFLSDTERYQKLGNNLFGKNYKKIKFNEFIKDIKNIHNCHWQPATNFLPTKDNKVLVDFVGKTESIKSDWKVVREKLNIEKRLPTLKKSPKSIKINWNKESIDTIRKLFKKDIELLKYKNNYE